MSGKVRNPETTRLINVNGAVYKALIKKGYSLRNGVLVGNANIKVRPAIISKKFLQSAKRIPKKRLPLPKIKVRKVASLKLRSEGNSKYEGNLTQYQINQLLLKKFAAKKLASQKQLQLEFENKRDSTQSKARKVATKKKKKRNTYTILRRKVKKFIKATDEEKKRLGRGMNTGRGKGIIAKSKKFATQKGRGFGYAPNGVR
jgi:hypothetical protein